MSLPKAILAIRILAAFLGVLIIAQAIYSVSSHSRHVAEFLGTKAPAVGISDFFPVLPYMISAVFLLLPYHLIFTRAIWTTLFVLLCVSTVYLLASHFLLGPIFHGTIFFTAAKLGMNVPAIRIVQTINYFLVPTILVASLAGVLYGRIYEKKRMS